MIRTIPCRPMAPALVLAAAASLAAQPPAAAVPFTLPNGLKVEFRPAPSARALTAVLIMPTATRDGLTALAPHALRLGGGGPYGYRDVDEQLEAVGASLEAEAGTDFTALRLRVFPQDLRAALAILGALLSDPVYPDLRANFARGRREAVQDAPTLAFSALMGSEGAGDWRRAGTAELKAWHRAHWLPARTRLLVSGPLDVETLKANLGAGLGAWKAEAATPAPAAPKTLPVRGGTYLRRDPGLKPAVVLAGVPVAGEAEETALELALDSLPSGVELKGGPGWRALRATAPHAGLAAEARRLREALLRLGQQGLAPSQFMGLLARHRERRRVEGMDPERSLLRAARAALSGPVAEPTLEGVNALLKRLLKPDEIRVLVVGEPPAPLPGATVLKD